MFWTQRPWPASARWGQGAVGGAAPAALRVLAEWGGTQRVIPLQRKTSAEFLTPAGGRRPREEAFGFF